MGNYLVSGEMKTPRDNEIHVIASMLIGDDDETNDVTATLRIGDGLRGDEELCSMIVEGLLSLAAHIAGSNGMHRGKYMELADAFASRINEEEEHNA